MTQKLLCCYGSKTNTNNSKIADIVYNVSSQEKQKKQAYAIT